MVSASGEPVVLCVDDSPNIRNTLKRVFLDEKWDLHIAASGEDALAIAREHDVDLALSDYRMPNMDGIEFLRRIHEIRPECMRLILSGYANINVIVTALNEGEIYKFIAKPWNDGELQHNVRKALEHHSLNRENRRLNEELRAFNATLERKVEERTCELREKNRTLRFAQVVLELLPMPSLGVASNRMVVFANAKARELFGDELVGWEVPPIFEPELSGALGDVKPNEPAVLPMVVDGEPVGAIILTAEKDPLDLELMRPLSPFRWSVEPT